MAEKKSSPIRKDEIIRAALKVIGRKGVGALTTVAIAEEAGMSEANLYRHFSGKEDIYFSLAEFIGSAIMGKAEEIAAGNLSPWEKLETIFFSHIHQIEEHPGIPRFIFSEDICIQHQKLAKKISIRLKNYVDTFSGVIEAGISDGIFRQSLSPRETALTLLGMIQSTALRWSLTGKSFDLEAEAQKIWRNFSSMVR